MVVPLLPTTPFLLLALWFFARSSPALRTWLLTNKVFGKYLDDYAHGRGLPVKVKIYVLALLWGTIIYAAAYITGILWVRVMLICIAIAVTLHILLIKNKRRCPGE